MGNKTLFALVKATIFTLLLSLQFYSFAANEDHINQELNDRVITTLITAKYTKNVMLNPLKIYVSTDRGTVTLKGHVKSKAAYVTALRLARDTSGVKSINTSELYIKKVNTPLTDAYITAKVEAQVLKAKVFDDEAIPLVGVNATTTNGVVTISGDLPTEKAINAILHRVARIKGVKKIISKLKVEPNPHEKH